MTAKCKANNAKLKVKCKGSPYFITKRSVLGLIPVLGMTAGDVSHKPGGRLPLLNAMLTSPVTPATLNRAATSFAAW